MAVYKLFPIQDASIYSAYPAINTGLDAILEVNNEFPSIDPSPRIARSLIQFSQTQLENVFSNKVGASNWSSSLKLFIADAEGITSDTTIKVYPLTNSWNNGTGQYLDSPETTNGVSWSDRLESGSGAWSSEGGDYTTDYSGSQTFNIRDYKDLNINTTEIISQWSSSALDNHGFMVKLTGSQELIPSSSFQPTFKFYSVDTNTIYPPVLEIKWDDSIYSTNLTEIGTTDVFMALDENPGVFYSESINRFRLNVRPKYPVRIFKTSSLYTSNYALPTASYYAIKDVDTNEFVVDFDEDFTKISCDNTSSYFDVYMDGLEPERYYKILIQTTINGSTIIKDDKYYFKVING